MDLILIRHGQSKGNANNIVQGHLDEGLSDLGLDQANMLSKYFNNNDINYIYSSDLGRAIQTAEPSSKKLNISIKINPDFKEAGFGIWEGMTYDEVREKYSKEFSAWHGNYFIRPDWFESFENHQTRVRKGIEEILANHKKDDKIAIFTHGGSIKTQVGYFNKLSGQELIKISISNCSLTHINFKSNDYESGELSYFNKNVISEPMLKL